MFIDYVMTVCERVMRQAAEDHPANIYLQNMPVESEDNAESPKEAS